MVDSGWCLGGAEEWSSRGNGQEERSSASVPAQRDYADTNIFSWIYSLLIAAEGQICKESVVIEGVQQQPSAHPHTRGQHSCNVMSHLIIVKQMLSTIYEGTRTG